MLSLYVPILVLAAWPPSSRSSRSGWGADRPEALEPGETRRLRVRDRADPAAVGGSRFPVKYYLTAMLFILFDIEIVFLYPWAVAFDRLGVFGLVEMVLFIVTVLVAYAYVWRRGGLEWD